MLFEHLTSKGKPYLTRVHLTPWRRSHKKQVWLHIFWGPDNARSKHDHPRDFWTLCCWGGYDEEILDVKSYFEGAPVFHTEVHKFGKWKHRLATHAHEVSRLHRTPTITLVLAGKKYRQWGFFMNGGWVHWKDYPG